jgi:hypothetical protein
MNIVSKKASVISFRCKKKMEKFLEKSGLGIMDEMILDSNFKSVGNVLKGLGYWLVILY